MKTITETTKVEISNANDNYRQAIGTDHYYKHFLGFHYTDGVCQMSQDCESFWLLDIIASYQTAKHVKCEDFQTWTLSRIKDNQFIVTATDGNDNMLVRQKIPFSDFKFDVATIWMVNRVMLLPSEY